MTSEMGCRRRLGHRRWRFGCGQAVLLILSLSSLTMLSYGCISWSAADGTQHALILGVGLVSTKHIPGHAAAAVRAHTVGLTVHTGRPLAGLALGYQSLQHTAIPSGWQGMVEVSSGLGQPLRIESCKPESVPVPLAISLTPAKEIE